MKKIISNFILAAMVCLPAVSFAGQHSGLGGTPPSTPVPPEPGMYETFELYLNSYYQWIREQIEQQSQNQNGSVSQQK